MTLLAFCIGLLHGLAADFPPITQLGPTNNFGEEVQLSMRMMADSPAERKRTVKVLFYGQSITQGPWFLSVSEWLRQQYPNANLIITNRAVGYTALLLTRIADADILTFYPDLIIYHNFGQPHQIDGIIARARARTTADILIQNDHPMLPEHLTEQTNILAELLPDARRSYVDLPLIAQRYGAELCDVRTPWKAYLDQYGLQPEEVLWDQVHPDEHGCYLMTEIVKSYLRVDRSMPADSWQDAVRTIPLPQEGGNYVILPFTGNRVDAIVSKNGNGPVQVSIDRRKPSEFPELYAFSRPEFYPGTHHPCILQVNSRVPLLDETWSAIVLEYYTIGETPHIRFEMRGSKTGPDGEGSSEVPFISNSGRVMTDPFDFLMLTWAKSWYPRVLPLPVGYEIKWESRFYGTDEFVPEITDPALENTVTLAQGLANGPHTLTLEGDSLSAIEAIRIYNPLARTQPPPPVQVRIESALFDGAHLTVRASGTARYVLESSETLGDSWHPLTSPQTGREVTVPVNSQSAFLRLRQLD